MRGLGGVLAGVRGSAIRRLVLVGATGLMLAACATQTTSDPPAAAAVEPPTGAASPAAAAPAHATAPAARPLPAGRAARAPTPPPPEPAADPEAMTITKAREQCWMQAETNRVKDIDTRVKLVQKCVDQKMNASIGR